MLSKRFEQALQLAHVLHADQTRKGSEIPYMTHLMAVSAIVGEHGGSEDAMIAALLHDAVEDQGGQETADRIRDAFGDTIAEWVGQCSDTTETPKPPWRARKEAFIARIPLMPEPVRLIVAADKIHNAQSVIRDHRAIDAAVWERFRGGHAGTLWYYQSVYAELSTDWQHPILGDLKVAVDTLHTLDGPDA